MAAFAIVAHRGVPTEAPENTLASFQRAIDKGADAVELDVRLTADHVPVVYHYFYLDVAASAGPIFTYSLDQLRRLSSDNVQISTLAEVLETIGGQIGLEIELKGPEPEVPALVASVLHRFKPLWDNLEITSYEPALLREVRRHCPGLAVDLLVPPSEPWMKLDVVAYAAWQRARLAGARAVHLHPTQLSAGVISTMQRAGLEIHAWGVNDEPALRTTWEVGIPRICTDTLRLAVDFRRRFTG